MLCGAILHDGLTLHLLLGQITPHLQFVPDTQPLPVGQLEADGHDVPDIQIVPVGQAVLVMQLFTVGMLEPVII